MAIPSTPSSPVRGPSLRALSSALDFDFHASRKRNHTLKTFLFSLILGTVLSLVIQIVVMSRTPCRLMRAAAIYHHQYGGRRLGLAESGAKYLSNRSTITRGHTNEGRGGSKSADLGPQKEGGADTGGVRQKRFGQLYDGPSSSNSKVSPGQGGKGQRAGVGGADKLLLVGVMTARKFLDTRVMAGHRTWAKDIPGRVIYFCSDVRAAEAAAGSDNSTVGADMDHVTRKPHYPEAGARAFRPMEVMTNKDGTTTFLRSRDGSERTLDQVLLEDPDDIPLVISLPGVNDAYPPQKKSFMMYKFMYANFGHEYKWFIRADDDVYIKGKKLAKILRSLNSDEPYYIGQTGQGKKEELGTLHLNYDENFCMGGPSMIMSRETLKRMAPHIKYCLNHLYTSHEDVEIGRCVKTFASIPCTWSYETQWLFYHYASSNSIWIRKSTPRNIRTYNYAITLHPFKSHTSFYDAHAHYKTQKMAGLRNRLWHLKRVYDNLKSSQSDDASRYRTKADVAGQTADRDGNTVRSRRNVGSVGDTDRPSTIETKDTVPVYGHSIQNQVSLAVSRSNPRRKMEPAVAGHVDDLRNQIVDHLNQLARHDGIIFTKGDIFWTYDTYDDTRAYRYLLNLGLTYRKFGGDDNWLEAGFDISVPFQGLLFGEVRDRGTGSVMTQATKIPKAGADDMPTHLRRGLARGNKVLNDLASYLWKPVDGNVEGGNSVLNKWLPPVSNVDRSATDPIGEEGSGRIYFIVPLYERLTNFLRFLKNYEEVCLKGSQTTELLIVMFQPDDAQGTTVEQEPTLAPANGSENLTHALPDPNEPYIRTVMDSVKELQTAYPDRRSHLRVLSIKGEFSRGLALEVGASQYKDHDLLFFVDVDMVFAHGFLHRARHFARFNESIYYPAVLSQFNPRPLDDDDWRADTKDRDPDLNATTPATTIVSDVSPYFALTDHLGYWRLYGFGIVAIYKHDFRRAGGFDMSILGWGKEDVDLFDKCLEKGYTVYRTPDPGLIHVFHDNECPSGLENDQFLMCVKSKANNLGSTANLGDWLYSNGL